MNELHDLLLPRPWPDSLTAAAMFAGFYVHLAFVLLAVGTGLLAVYYFIETWWAGRLSEARWDKEILGKFMALKALMVVWGVAPLLLVQMAFSVPFLTAANILGAYWVLILLFLMGAFVFFDSLGHRMETHRYLHLVLAVLSLTLLLAVPGVFVAVMVAAENPNQWVDMVRAGYRLSGPLAWFWLVRYLHVLGAAVIFGGLFHYIFTSGGDPKKRSKLLAWVMGGTLFQVPIGLILYAQVPGGAPAPATVALLVGVALVAVFLWIVYAAGRSRSVLPVRTLSGVLLLALLCMLLTRQVIQDRTFVPLARNLDRQATAYAEEIKPYASDGLAAYEHRLKHPVDSGSAMYATSCAFCHGEQGRSKTPSAGELKVPPTAIADMRTSRAYAYHILTTGVPGTGMPSFLFYDRGQLGMLLDYLGKKWDIYSAPGRVPVKVSADDMKQARQVWKQTCAVCHGTDGRGNTSEAASAQPRPPDLTAYSLTPRALFRVVTDGYPGTTMMPSAGLPEGVRWGLVAVVLGKRAPKPGQ